MESFYWKEFLLKTASELRHVKHPKPLTLRRMEIVERDIVISFFVLRRLIELHKVSNKVKDFQLSVFAWPSTGKLATLINKHRIDELYDYNKEKHQIKKPIYICNQIIHSYSMELMIDDTRNWDSLLTVSDYDRKNCIWRIPMKTILKLLRTAAKDYPSRLKYTMNAKIDDYDVETD